MATTVDTLIFELKVKDEATKVFDAWEKRLADMAKQAEQAFKDIKFDLPDTSNFGSGILSSLTGVVGQASSLLLSGFTAIFSGIVSLASKTFTAIKDIGVKAFKTLYDTVKEGVKVYAQFEDDISVARRTMGLTAEQTEALGDAMDDLSLTIRGATANDMYKIAGIAGNLGLNFKDGKENVERFVAAITKIGIATDLSVEKAAEQIPSILTQFRVANDQMGEETERFGNVLNELGNKMNVTQSQILKVAASLSGSAASAGMTKEHMLALSAAVGVIDKKFGTAGGNVSQILVKLITDSESWAKTLGMNAEQLLTTIRENPVKALEMVLGRLDELKQNKAVDEFAAIIQDLGLKGYRTGESMKKLVMAKDELAKAMDIVTQQMIDQDSLNKEAEASADRLSKLWATVQNAINLVYKAIGEPFVDVLNQILNDYVIPLTLEFVKWFRESESVEFALRSIAENLGAIVTNHLAPLAASMLEWITSSNAIDEIFRDKIPSAMLTIQVWVGKIIDKVHEWFNYLVENGDEIWAGIKQGLSDAWEILGKVIDFIKEVPGYIEKISPGVKILVGGFTTLFEKINDIVNLFTGNNETIVGLFQNITDRVYGVQEAFDSAKQASDDYTGLTTTGVNAVTAAVDTLKTSVNATTGAVNELGIEAVEQSVFPEMKVAIAETAAEVDLLGDSLVMVQDGVMLVGEKADQAFKDMAAAAKEAGTEVDKLITKETKSATIANATTAAQKGYTSATPGDTSEFKSTYADLNALMDKQKQLYGKTYGNAQVATTQIAKLAKGVYANTPYMGILDDMQAGIGENAKEIEKLGYWTGKASDAIKIMGDEAVYNSVFPDISTAIKANESDLHSLANTITNATGYLDSLGESANSAISKVNEIATSSLGTTTSTVTNNTTNTATEDLGGGKTTKEIDASTTVNISFEGTNIVDESSKDRFVREIATQLKTLGSKSISV